MSLPLLIIIVVLLMGGLLTWGYSRSWGDSEAAAMPMNAENVWMNLRYDQANLISLLRYVHAHDVERGGRYDIRKPPRLNIWTHTWINPGCRAESSLMFSLEFNWSTGSLILVRLRPGYDWEVFLDELARLERAALGDMVYGKSRCQPKM